MARYIDADTLKKLRDDAISGKVNIKTEGDLIDACPTANVVEVVRCGQCKYWKINPNNLFGGYCRYCDGAKIDHYCSYGERKK